MNGRVSKARTRRSRLNISKVAQGRLLEAITTIDTEPLRRSTRLRSRQDSATNKGSVTAVTSIPSCELQPKTSRYIHIALPEPTVEGQGQVCPVTRLRKRQIDGDSKDKGDHNGDDKHQLKRARLTRKNLFLLNKMAKKNDTDKTSTSTPSESTVLSSKTKTTSTTSPGFAIQAYKNGILAPRSSKPPKNIKVIREKLVGTRETAPPSELRFGHYINRVEGASNEATMIYEVGQRLLKEYEDTGYKKVFNQAFTGYPKEMGFNNGLSAPQPDFVEGLEMREYRPFPIDEHINGAVLYKDDPFSLVLPHIAGEWKGSGKDMEEAKLQSAYDGAALVYARNEALSYIGKPDPDGYAVIITFTTDGANLNFFAHYAAMSEDNVLEYHQYLIMSRNAKNSYQEFKDCRRGLRNMQDYAKENSYALRDELKKHWKAKQNPKPAVLKAATSDNQPPQSLKPTIPPLRNQLLADSPSSNDDAGHDDTSHDVIDSIEPPTPLSSNQDGRQEEAKQDHEKELIPAIPAFASSSAKKRKASSSARDKA